MPFDLQAHLAPLQVVIPLMAAPFAIILRRPALAWAWATVVSAVVVAIALTLLGHVITNGTISYAVGGWEPPWGIELHIDLLSALMLVLVSGIGLMTVIYGRLSVQAEIHQGHIYLYYICYLLCLTGLMGMVITGDAFNLFVFLEISSLSSYAMISLGKSRKALTAAYNYLVLGTIGATFYVIGIGLIYMVTGTLNMADIAHELAKTPVNRTELVAVAFLIVGLALKLALFPLHKWLPNAYAHAPSVVTTFLASTATKVSLYVVIRVFFTVLGTAPFMADRAWAESLIPFAVVGMFSASAAAIFQTNIKKMLAYSSVAQIGYMALGVGMANSLGLTAGILHMLNHAVIKGTLFMAVGCVVLRVGSTRLAAWQGLGRQMPLTMFAFVIGGISLMGVPLTAGFVSKWYLMLAAFDKGWWPLAVLIVLSSLLAVVYIWRVVEAIYLRPALPRTEPVKEAPWSMLVPLYVMVAANIWFGIDTTYTVDLAQAAATALIDALPAQTPTVLGALQ
jgi:multicomponent Na+:H+ antiporter subunit D